MFRGSLITCPSSTPRLRRGAGTARLQIRGRGVLRLRTSSTYVYSFHDYFVSRRSADFLLSLISNSRSVHCPCFLGHDLAQKRTRIEDEGDASVVKDGGTRNTRHIPENSVQWLDNGLALAQKFLHCNSG